MASTNHHTLVDPPHFLFDWVEEATDTARPVGVPLEPARRRWAAAWAIQTGALIVEDDSTENSATTGSRSVQCGPWRRSSACMACSSSWPSRHQPGHFECGGEHALLSDLKVDVYAANRACRSITASRAVDSRTVTALRI